MPKMSVTPCATSVSTSASDGVIFTLPRTTSRLPWAMSFMRGSLLETNGKISFFGTVYAVPVSTSALVMTMEEEQKIELHRGLKGVYFDRSRVCDIDGRAGELRYRGYSIHDLAEHSTFEETCHLLLRGELPNA